jgi:anaerobic selenocysteine-containing dehydrogenase
VGAARRQGTTLITIDPRFTETARASDIWIQIRPGTDDALALAWLNSIIGEELCDRDFVEKHSVGFDELKDRIRGFTPEKAAEITWVPV